MINMHEAKLILARHKSNNQIQKKLAKAGIQIDKKDIVEYVVVILDDGRVEEVYPNAFNQDDNILLQNWYKNGQLGAIGKNLYNVELKSGPFVFEVYPYFGCCKVLVGCLLKCGYLEQAKLIYMNSKFLKQRVGALGW